MQPEVSGRDFFGEVMEILVHQNQLGQVTKPLLNSVVLDILKRAMLSYCETWTVQCESQDKCCQLRPDWYKSHVRQSLSNALIFTIT